MGKKSIFRNTTQAFIALTTLVLLRAPVFGDEVRYELTFDSTWSAATHPVDYPANAHYSGTVGLTHTENYTLWAPGTLSSPGIKELAERGVPNPLNSEVAAAIADGHGFEEVRLSAISTTPASKSSQFRASSTHPLLSFASMIAPSPDWIVGAHDVPLQQDGIK